MADYYLILKKTISELAHNTQEARDVVYDKARSIIRDQLEAIKPTPTEATIGKQMALLEAAVKKLDNEFSQLSELRMPEDDWQQNSNTPSDSGTLHSMPEDPLGMEYSETILAENPDVGGMENENMEGRQGWGFFSRLLFISLMFAVVGIGLYALWINRQDFQSSSVQGEKPKIPDSLRNDDRSNDVPGHSGNQLNTSDKQTFMGRNEAKNSERLTTDGKTIEMKTEPPGTESAVDGQGYNVVEKSRITDNTSLSGQTSRPSGDTAQQVTEIDQGSGIDDLPSSKAPSVAQKAFFYEEGVAGGTNASRDDAAIVWSLEREKPGNNKSEFLIKGKFDVPGRNIGMNLEIRPNHDDSLPASHIIRIMFRLPREFDGGDISDILRLVMKSSEQARGESLIAVSAKVSTNNFLIALNNLEEARGINQKLLLENAWIDLPLKYTNGNRALIALEKGAIGNKVFQEAFASWKKQ